MKHKSIIRTLERVTVDDHFFKAPLVGILLSCGVAIVKLTRQTVDNVSTNSWVSRKREPLGYSDTTRFIPGSRPIEQQIAFN